MAWARGKVTSVTVRSVGGEQTRLKWGGWDKTIALQSGESITVVPQEA
jgi:alpha-L-fucosidase 2